MRRGLWRHCRRRRHLERHRRRAPGIYVPPTARRVPPAVRRRVRCHAAHGPRAAMRTEDGRGRRRWRRQDRRARGARPRRRRRVGHGRPERGRVRRGGVEDGRRRRAPRRAPRRGDFRLRCALISAPSLAIYDAKRHQRRPPDASPDRSRRLPLFWHPRARDARGGRGADTHPAGV